MPAYFLVDVGQVIPVLAKNAKDAAYLALIDHPNPANGQILVQERDSDDSDVQVYRFVLAARKCRKCGCTDDRACLGGCCWVEWDLCNQCRVQ